MDSLVSAVISVRDFFRRGHIFQLRSPPIKEEEINREPLKTNPIKTYDDLLQFNKSVQYVAWRKLIPIQSKRGEARYYGQDCSSMETKCVRRNETTPKRYVLVCHDMMGNYREDCKFNTSKKWDDYRFYHWSGVDFFCYFSHDFITIPPAGWTSAAHLHGVSVLGLLITEGAEPHWHMDAILKSTESVEKTCLALVSLCEYYNFEGYLLNLESPVTQEQLPNLKYFIEYLTEEIHRCIPNGFVLWYDSVKASNGKISWQNSLNDENREFFSRCDGIYLNYCWSSLDLKETKATIDKYYPGCENKVFVGIDVFGRGQVGKLHSNATLNRITPYNYSVAIFAPGWTYESMSDQGLKLNECEGQDKLNEEFLKCNELFWHLLFEILAVNVYTKLPMYSNFCLGSGKKRFDMSQPIGGSFFNLTTQSLQPSVPLPFHNRYFEDAVDGGCCLKFSYPNWTRIFATDFFIRKTLIFAFATKSSRNSHLVDCMLSLRKLDNNMCCRLICGQRNSFSYRQGNIYLPYVEPQNEYKIIKLLHKMGQNLVIPFTLANDWTVRYYAVSFDSPVIVKDVGAGVENLIANQDTCLLGAVYLHGGDACQEGTFIIQTKKYFQDEENIPSMNFEDELSKSLIEEKKILSLTYKIS